MKVINSTRDKLKCEGESVFVSFSASSDWDFRFAGYRKNVYKFGLILTLEFFDENKKRICKCTLGEKYTIENNTKPTLDQLKPFADGSRLMLVAMYNKDKPTHLPLISEFAYHTEYGFYELLRKVVDGT